MIITYIFEITNMYEQIFKLHAKLLHAIAHSRRLEIIHLLRGQTLSVGEITKMLDLPQANISQHLQILRLAGVVKTQKRGKLVNFGAQEIKKREVTKLLGN